MNRKGGDQRKARSKLRKNVSDRGVIPIRNFFQTFKIGETVQLQANSSIQKGRFPLRFHGKHGIVEKKKGKAYYVQIKDQSKSKSVIVLPVHLKKLETK